MWIDHCPNESLVAVSGSKRRVHLYDTRKLGPKPLFAVESNLDFYYWKIMNFVTFLKLKLKIINLYIDFFSSKKSDQML